MANKDPFISLVKMEKGKMQGDAIPLQYDLIRSVDIPTHEGLRSIWELRWDGLFAVGKYAYATVALCVRKEKEIDFSIKFLGYSILKFTLTEEQFSSGVEVSLGEFKMAKDKFVLFFAWV